MRRADLFSFPYFQNPNIHPSLYLPTEYFSDGKKD